jgi:alkanesulfonate monooxygenase SsuD/methylene tetrahydromethanopterin reductase-like flavin-dependent oxidoreductase (luciferase family)
VELGILLTDVVATTSPEQHFSDMRRVTEAAARNGFTYIGIGQHFLYGHIRWLQPVPVLARLAADVDKDVKLLTNVMIGPVYHPVILAEEIATLDIVTEGRFVFGVGLGYRDVEFDYVGIPFKERAPRLDEMLELMTMLWTQDEVTFNGKFYQLDAVQPHIQPIQKPHPPIWVGGTAKAGARRAGRLGDAYLTSPEADPAEVRDRFTLVRDGFALRGKEFGPQPIRRNIAFGTDVDDALNEYIKVAGARNAVFAAAGIADTGDEAATMKANTLLGTAEQIIAQVQALSDLLPIEPLILRPQWPYSSAEDAIAMLDRLGREVVPAVRAIVPRRDLP